MRRGERAELRAKKVLISGCIPDGLMHTCRVLYLNEKEECIYLLVEESELEELSLDNVYECKIKSKDSIIKCSGRIRERYIGTEGKIIKFQIENGFYKINIKSVDKQIV